MNRKGKVTRWKTVRDLETSSRALNSIVWWAGRCWDLKAGVICSRLLVFVRTENKMQTLKLTWRLTRVERGEMSKGKCHSILLFMSYMLYLHFSLIQVLYHMCASQIWFHAAYWWFKIIQDGNNFGCQTKISCCGTIKCRIEFQVAELVNCKYERWPARIQNHT